MRHRRSLFIILSSLALYAVCALVLNAQSTARLIIQYSETEDQDQALGVNVYFTLLDGGGEIIANAQIATAAFVLEDGSRYEATVETANSTFYVILALDASRSIEKI